MFIFNLFHNFLEFKNLDFTNLIIEVDFQLIIKAQFLLCSRPHRIFECAYQGLPLKASLTTYLVNDSF